MVFWAAVLVLVVKVRLIYISRILLGSFGTYLVGFGGLIIADRELAAESKFELDGKGKRKSLY